MLFLIRAPFKIILNTLKNIVSMRDRLIINDKSLKSGTLEIQLYTGARTTTPVTFTMSTQNGKVPHRQEEVMVSQVVKVGQVSGRD